MPQCHHKSPRRNVLLLAGGVAPSGRGRLQCRVAVDIVSTFMGVPAADILSERRAQAPIARARHIAMYLAHVAFQLSLNAVAQGFGRDRTSVSYAVGRIEDERDDRSFDMLLNQMETLAQSCRRLAVPGAGEGDV